MRSMYAIQLKMLSLIDVNADVNTDVLIIAIVISSEIPSNLFIRFGTKNDARIISVEKVKQSLMLRYDFQDAGLLSKSLLSFHAFTGCDTVSAFCGKGNWNP